MTKISSAMPICLAALILFAVVGIFPNPAEATILGVTGTSFDLTAKGDVISTGDGDSMWMWGYALNNDRMQYPAPTLIVNQGDNIRIRLYNMLPVPVSIVFPGLNVSASGNNQNSDDGLLTKEVKAWDGTGNRSGPVTYRFTASRPGTYIYYSGTRPDLQVEMGLVGAIIVRPENFDPDHPRAYNDPLTAYNQEYLFFESEADPVIHQKVAFASGNQATIAAIDMTKRHATVWFLNGRNFPDTMSPANVGWLPTQPYNCMPMTHPGELVLMRMIGGGLDMHPYHTHGQNHLIIARDARLLSSDPQAANPVPDLAVSDFTTTGVPGETVDALWGPWTGEKLGWDIYGTADINPHTCDGCTTEGCPNPYDSITHEYCPDHYKPIPVALPSDSELDIGVVGIGMWSGSPYMGMTENLPPATTGQNPMGGYSYMWHSHNERELTTNNIFPGGMSTMALVVPTGTPIP